MPDRSDPISQMLRVASTRRLATDPADDQLFQSREPRGARRRMPRASIDWQPPPPEPVYPKAPTKPRRWGPVVFVLALAVAGGIAAASIAMSGRPALPVQPTIVETAQPSMFAVPAPAVVAPPAAEAAAAPAAATEPAPATEPAAPPAEPPTIAATPAVHDKSPPRAKSKRHGHKHVARRAPVEDDEPAPAPAPAAAPASSSHKRSRQADDNENPL